MGVVKLSAEMGRIVDNLCRHGQDCSDFLQKWIGLVKILTGVGRIFFFFKVPSTSLPQGLFGKLRKHSFLKEFSLGPF